MDKFFVSIYQFFSRKKWLMWVLLVLSSAVFVYYGLQVEFEEDMSKLLPETERATEQGLAFGNLRVKDKVFVQFTRKDGEKDVELLAEVCDDLMDSLLAHDKDSLVSNVLYKIDDDVLVMGLDYVLSELPTWIDTTTYTRFDACLTQEAIDEQMSRNVELLSADESKIDLITQDPLGLRYVLLSEGNDLRNGAGFTMVESHLFCPDSTVLLAFVSPNFKSFDSKRGTYLIEHLEEEIERVEALHPEVEVLFHGNAVNGVFNSRQIKKDLTFTVGISLLLICVVIALCFKSKSTLWMLLCPVVYGTFAAMACMYWIKGGMSLLAIAIGVVVLGIAISYCLHILTHSKYVADPVQLLRDQSTPVCLSCITTIGAFAGLLLTQSDLLKDFGMFASFALVGTTLFALIFLPHFFGENQSDHSEKAFALLAKINSYPLDKNKWWIITLLLICVVCFGASWFVEFDDNLRHIGYYEPKVIRSMDLYATKNNDGLQSMYYAASAKELDDALAYNKNILATCDSLQQAGVIKRYSKTSKLLLTTQEQQERIDAWKRYWSDEKVADVQRKIDLAARKNGLEGDIFEPFTGLLTADYAPASLYDAGVLPESLMSNFVELCDSNYMVFTSVVMDPAETKRVSDAIAANDHAVVIDPFYYTNDMVQRIHDDFNIVLFVSSIFVFVVLLISFRSITRALLAFLPMFLSWYVVEGFMYLFGLQFNLINIIISSFIFGVGVDYSIFVMDGLLADTRKNNKALLTYHKTAIFLSAFTLVVVICSLLFAKHPALRSVGICTLIGMTSTVLLAYTLQPFLFRKLMRLPLTAKHFGRKPRFRNKEEQ